jgi:serine/threonine-protein kinase/endoribonuclease IRE1
VTYSVWGPNNIDSDLKAQHVKSLDNLYVTPLYDNSILALSTDGRRKPARWVGHITSTAVNVFDVFRSQKVSTDSTLMLLPQPRFYTHSNNDDHFLLHSAFIQQTDSGQWFAMSGFNFPSFVQSAPLSMWSEQKQIKYDTYEEFLHAIAGVHVNLDDINNFDKIHSQTAASSGPLGIDAPSSFRAEYNSPKVQYQYDYENQVFRPSSEISRSSPPNPLPPTPPQPPVDSISKSRILNGLLRIVENALAFVVFFIFLILAGRYGWLNQVSGLAELTSKLQPQQTSLEHLSSSEEKSDYLEKRIETTDHFSDIELPGSHTISDGTITPKMTMTDTETILSPMTPSTPTDSLSPRPIDIKNPQVSKKVEILEPEKPPIDTQNTATSAPVVKKRKRGSRGGRKNNLAKKKEREEQILLEQANNAGTAATDECVTTDIMSLPPSGLPAGSLLDVSKDVIGYGSHGTVVLKGTFENREVAVKRMLLDFYEVASQEVSLLQESDDHPNVIRYFCKQVNDRFLYIALELCPGTLEDLIEKPEKFLGLNSSLTTSEIFYQIASGVHHLHCLKIVHRDLKPQNILVAPPKVITKKDASNKETVGPVRMLISDFGLCKKLEGDQSSFRATTANAAGTSGWRAPELLIDEQDSVYNHTILQEAYPTGSSSEPLVIDSLSNRRATRAIDIFSLGCVFYYILSKGIHPFGDKYLREANIVQGNYSLDYLEDYSKPDMVESRDLIERMISRDPRLRPDAKQILKHPLFWSQEKRLDFLLKVSDRFDIESRDPPSKLLSLLEANASKVVGDDWHDKLNQEFIDNLGKYRKYHGDRILDLLRAMRNKSHHFNDLPAAVRALMEPYPQGYLGYFTAKFPFLLMTIYYVVKNNLANEPMFRSFF